MRSRQWVRSSAVGLLAIIGLLLGSPTGLHAEPGAQQAAVARSAFDQALELMKEGKNREACPKLEESLRLDPGLGTRFHLARCYEATGRTASAWSLYLDVASAARNAGQSDREQVARDAARAVEPKVPRVIIMVPEHLRSADLEVTVDGTAVGQAMWATPMPLDPGPHKVQTRRPGKSTWSQSFELPADGRTVSVPVSAMDTDSAPPPSASAAPAAAPAAAVSAPVATTASPAAVPAQPDGWGTRKTVGAVVGGAGVLGIAVGSVLALSAKSRYDDANCAGNLCDAEGTDIRNSALDRGNVATVIGAVGLVALGTGAVLFLTAGSSERPERGSKSGVGMALTPGMVSIGGRW